VRNIFLFIRRYSNFLFFLLLQGVSIFFIAHYNTYHNSIATSYLNAVSGSVNQKVDNTVYYLQLKKTNDSLMKANERLYNQLKIDFALPDTTSKSRIDTIRIDSILQYRLFNYLSAKVVYNSVSQQNNFLEINRGSDGSVRKDVGVVDANNHVVGVVTDVSDKYAVVMSLLNRDSHISAMLKNSKDAGTVIWDGKDPNRLLLADIRKSAKVAKGDSVISSGYTTHFPYGLLIGTVEEIVPDKSTNNYFIKLKSAANFYSLPFVYVIDNVQKESINKLLDKVKKQNQ
jgi:rod shape-determining protein MreC